MLKGLAAVLVLLLRTTRNGAPKKDVGGESLVDVGYGYGHLDVAGGVGVAHCNCQVHRKRCSADDWEGGYASA